MPEDASEATDTIVAVDGPVIPCPYFDAWTEEGCAFCTRFQIRPKCEGDVNHCDVLMFAPDPRDGYR